jgi:glycosyltransferase involved in cell wall biosynthesis
MGFMRYPEFAEDKNLRFLNAYIKRTAERADAVIAVSDFGAREIRELLGVPGDRVFAVHSGISDEFAPADADGIDRMRRDLRLDRPYLLTVGTIEPRKNHEMLIDAFERLPGFDGYLVIAGARGWKCEAIFDRIRTSKCAGRIKYVGFPDDGLLPALYSGAELFVFPSFYEGFGFPPLEAMACGTPVFSSNGGSLPEVLGDAAVLMDGFDGSAWAAGIEDLLADSERRRALVERGRARAAAYTWAETARRTWQVYERVAG